jgi:hypothetical protein
MTRPLRAEAMERRILRTAAALAIAETDLDLLRRAFGVGMERRTGLDDHHPDYLHPSRTALILMDDARVADVRVLATALVLETRDPAFRPLRESVRGLGADIAAIVESVPGLGDDHVALMERLVTLPDRAVLPAVAERLDHARHLHLRPRAEWRPYHDTMCSVYRPFADRVSPVLAARIDWWCLTFQRRFLEA